MVVPAIAIGIVVVLLLGWLLARRRFAAGPERRGTLAGSGSDGGLPRHETALDELRDLRDALKPAEHSRIERRRPGGAGPYIGPERRRTKSKSAPPRRPPE